MCTSQLCACLFVFFEMLQIDIFCLSLHPDTCLLLAEIQNGRGYLKDLDDIERKIGTTACRIKLENLNSQPKFTGYKSENCSGRQNLGQDIELEPTEGPLQCACFSQNFAAIYVERVKYQLSMMNQNTEKTCGGAQGLCLGVDLGGQWQKTVVKS